MPQKVNSETLYDYTNISTKFHWVYIFNFCALKILLVWNQGEKKCFRYTESRQGWKITDKWLLIHARFKAVRFCWQAMQSKWEKEKFLIRTFTTAAPRCSHSHSVCPHLIGPLHPGHCREGCRRVRRAHSPLSGLHAGHQFHLIWL